MKVLYLLPTATNQGLMRNLAQSVANSTGPDTLLMGLNRLPSYGVQAVPLPWGPPSFLGRLIAGIGLRWDPPYEFSALLEAGSFDLCVIKDLSTGPILGTAAKCLRSFVPIVYLDVVVSKSTPMKYGLGWIARGARAVVYCSPALRDLLRRELEIPDRLLHFVPWSVDTDFWRSFPSDDDGSSSPRILSVGFNDRDYGTFLSSASGLDAEIQIASSRLQVSSRIRITLHEFTPTELRKSYRRASIVVVPLKENVTASGITTLLEAMAMAKAVVATRTAATEFYTDNGRHAILVRPNDPTMMRSAIDSLLSDEKLARMLGERARDHVRSRFSTEQQASQLAELYKGITRSR
jgi:glycosyltransferase involved in cell wall biosynthesis